MSLVEALTGDGATGTLRRAVLAVDSDLPTDLDLLLTAAREATQLTDLITAERLVRAARDGGAGFDAQLLLGFVLHWHFRAEEAEQEFAAAAALADTDPRRLRVVHIRVLNLYTVLARADDAQAVLDGVAGCAGAEVELLGIRAVVAVLTDRLDNGETAARRVLDTTGVSAQAEGVAAWAMTGVLGLSGRGDQVPAVAARAVAAVLRAPEIASLQVNIGWAEAYGLGFAGLLAPVRRTANGLSSTLTGSFVTIFQSIFDGWLALLTGRVGAAAVLLREFRPYFPGHGAVWTSWLELVLAQALGMTGDVAGVREALERAEAHRHPGERFLQPQFALARAWLAAAEGTASVAVTQARRAADQAATSGQFAVEMYARHTAVGFGDRGQATRLAVLARTVDGPRAPAAAAHAAALAAGDPVALLAAAEWLAAAELMLPSAEAAAQAVTAAAQRRDLTMTAAATARMATLAAACAGARTPALIAAQRPFPITDRQREIAALVAAQLSNREIAERLGLSTRTVEGHVYTACTKLGLPDRSALAAVFTDRA